MKNAIILIDGENFSNKIEEVLKDEAISVSSVDISGMKLRDLILKIFKSYKDIHIKDVNYYAAKLSVYPPTARKSLQLIDRQRRLKMNLENQGVQFVISGNVRPQEVKDSRGKILKVNFKEKGVDVRIAVDMVSMAYMKKYDVIVLCSSDSDLQPAVAEARRMGTEIIYLGFSVDPNRGFMYTCNRSILIRNPEIVDSVS